MIERRHLEYVLELLVRRTEFYNFNCDSEWKYDIEAFPEKFIEKICENIGVKNNRWMLSSSKFKDEDVLEAIYYFCLPEDQKYLIKELHIDVIGVQKKWENNGYIR